MKKILKSELDKADFDKLREANDSVKGTSDYNKYYMECHEKHERSEFSLGKGMWTKWKFYGWYPACDVNHAEVTVYGDTVWIVDSIERYGVVSKYRASDAVNELLGIWEDV